MRHLQDLGGSESVGSTRPAGTGGSAPVTERVRRLVGEDGRPLIRTQCTTKRRYDMLYSATCHAVRDRINVKERWAVRASRRQLSSGDAVTTQEMQPEAAASD